ncbi:MAG: enoyl-[acyl-carrier-protein] reductase FabK [Chloroflexi bacterium]|nr:enoyl-[acyl-carrier-protein] reductase FabK [Chloroflexota bacterium]
MIQTTLCKLLGIDYPIIQGGMAWAGTAELASAVSNAGGLGVIGAGNAPPEWLRRQIQLARQGTDRPFGVNVMLMSPFAQEIVNVVIEEKVPVVTTGGGNPGVHLPRFKEAGIISLPVVPSVALAKRLERSGADAIIAEGMESGGHVGETCTLPLVPQVVDAVSVPVVAAGGIADGRGLVAALALGAQGVQMGTRFVCATECIAHINFKQKIVEARDRSTTVSGRSTGHPVRTLENRMSRLFQAMEKDGASVPDLENFGAGKLRLAVIEGDVESGSLMAGQSAGLVNDIKPAREIVQEIMAQAEALLSRLPQYLDAKSPRG